MYYVGIDIAKYKHDCSRTLRKTKTDEIDVSPSAHYLMTVEYFSYTLEFYHIYSLKSLARLWDSMVSVSYDKLRCISRGKFPTSDLLNL